MLTRLLASTLLVYACPATQGLSAQDIAPRGDAWAAFQLEHGDGWTAAWSKFTGTPMAIYGPGLAVKDGPITTLDEARRFANRTLDTHRDLLGLGTSTFVEDVGHRQRQLYGFVYRQLYRGLPVIGGRADVRVHAVGRISMFGAEAVPIPPNFVTVPTIDVLRARVVAYAHRNLARGRGIDGQPPNDDARLVIWADPKGALPPVARLAWEIQLDQRTPDLVVGRVYVDAHTGAVLEFADDVYTCSHGHVHVAKPVRRSAPAPAPAPTPTVLCENDFDAPVRTSILGSVNGFVNLGLRPYDPTNNAPLRNIEVQIQNVGTVLTGATGKFQVPYAGAGPVTVSVTMKGRHVASMTSGAGTVLSKTVQAMPGVPVSIQFLNSSAQPLQYSQTTAYYHTDDINRWTRLLLGNSSQLRVLDNIAITVNVPQSCNAFYTRNTINFYQASTRCYNTAYSTVVQHEWGHGLDNEYGGISRTDGLSEGWADVVAMLRTEQPIVGEDFFFNGDDIRTGLNDRTYPQSGGVHTQGQTWMGYCWDVRTNFVASVGDEEAQRLTSDLFIGTMPVNAGNQPNAVREVFLLDDDDGNLSNGTPHYNELAQAAIKRRLPFPRVNFGTVTHAPIANTEDQLTPQIVKAVATPQFGSWLSGTVVYDNGTSSSSQRMVRSPNQNEWVALIPGYLSPVGVSYHLEIEHSTGWVERVPESGELTYRIGREVVHFFDDFETGGQGWSHGRTLGADDWERGTPTGQRGTSGGVGWFDPPSAHSGTMAYGTDLGSGAGDYNRGARTWLATPQMNLARETGVVLTYRRWLTVEDGAADQAEVEVNNTQVWVNPSGEHFGDSQWVEHRIQIPQADLNPTAQVIWRMSSDGSIELGGWNIDDVTISSFTRLQPPNVKFTVTPAQIPLGSSGALLIEGTRNRPMAMLVSLSPGPTQFPGLPPLRVGSNFIAAAGFFDGAGQLGFNIQAPNDPQAAGVFIYSQALQLTRGGQIELSNAMVLLYGP